ncbi:MAG: hypothetical protein R3B84_02940 [Zavarzinella sp.]
MLAAVAFRRLCPPPTVIPAKAGIHFMRYGGDYTKQQEEIYAAEVKPGRKKSYIAGRTN